MPKTTVLQAWQALTSGDFHTMTNSEGECFNGASRNALLIELNGEIIIADLQDGMRLELFDGDGHSWVVGTNGDAGGTTTWPQWEQL